MILFLVFLFLAPFFAYFLAHFFGAFLAQFVTNISPGCVFYDLTGIKCPGCGGTRAMTALLQGDWKKALQFNIYWLPTLYILLVEYANAWLVVFERQYQYPKWTKFRIISLQTYAWGIVAFMVARNIWDF